MITLANVELAANSGEKYPVNVTPLVKLEVDSRGAPDNDLEVADIELLVKFWNDVPCVKSESFTGV